MMKRMATKKQVWNWKDDFQAEIAAKDNSELFALSAAYDNLNSNVASQRSMEQSIMVRAEVSRRNTQAEKMFGQAGLA